MNHSQEQKSSTLPQPKHYLKPRILFVEDHQGLAENLAEYFQEKYDCDFAFDGKTAMHLLEQNNYNVAVLDIMLPRANGHEIAHHIREYLNSNLPIIFLTALDSLEDKETAYSNGADDYLSKPFAMRELELRIQSITKRIPSNTKFFSAGILNYNPSTLTVARNEQSLVLSGLSAAIFETLIRHYPNIVDYEKIAQESWKNNNEVEEKTIRTQVYSLRKILRIYFGVGMIKTIHGRGYQLDPLSE